MGGSRPVPQTSQCGWTGVLGRLPSPSPVPPVVGCPSPGSESMEGGACLQPDDTHEAVAHRKLVTRLLRLRDATVEAVLWEDFDKLRQLAISFGNVTPTKAALLETGAGVLLADAALWALGGEPVGMLAKKAIANWKQCVKATKHDCAESGMPGRHPCAGMKAVPFLECVKDLVAWLGTVDAVAPDAVVRRKLAGFLVQAGFKHFSHLDSVVPSTLAVKVPAQAALLARAVRVATEHGAARRRGQGCSSGTVACAAPACRVTQQEVGGKSATAVATSLNPALVEAAEMEWRKMAADLGVALGDGPKTVVKRLAVASPVAAGRLLEERARQLRLVSKKNSLASVASGLRAWHGFATQVLGYEEHATLPPRSDDDVCKFISIFVVAGTAMNYVGYVKWACVNFSLGVDWWSAKVSVTLKGLRVEHVQRTGGQQGARVLLTDLWIAQMTALAKAVAHRNMSVGILVAYVFLLRVQSELISLEAGSPASGKSLPAGRHSAVWVSAAAPGGDSLHVRLARRKNKPGGSTLVRRCACGQGGAVGCVVHAVAPVLRGLPEGSKLFDFSASQFLKEVKRMLALLGHPEASRCTLKGFRAGRATSLADAGYGIGDILAAGEWKSSAFLRYCQADGVSVPGLLHVVLDCEEDEE